MKLFENKLGFIQSEKNCLQNLTQTCQTHTAVARCTLIQSERHHQEWGLNSVSSLQPVLLDAFYKNKTVTRISSWSEQIFMFFVSTILEKSLLQLGKPPKSKPILSNGKLKTQTLPVVGITHPPTAGMRNKQTQEKAKGQQSPLTPPPPPAAAITGTTCKIGGGNLVSLFIIHPQNDHSRWAHPCRRIH